MRHTFFIALAATLPQTSFAASTSERSISQSASTSTSQSRSISASHTASSVSASSPSASPVPDEPLADFNQSIPILGAMARTDQDFVDGLALDLFSPLNRTLVVTKNTAPLPGNFVRGSSGEPFVALSNYSWVVKMNESARDLIAKIELPYDPVMLGKMGVEVANTYVGVLERDWSGGMAWKVDESRRNVHVSENKTRIIKLTSLDGEYMLLGRRTLDPANIFVQYGQGVTRTVNITGGPGVQEAEFVDGLRFSVQSEKPFGMNVELKNGVGMNEGGGQSLINRAMLATKTSNATNAHRRLAVAHRALNATSQMFVPLAFGSQAVLENEDRIRVPGLRVLDGEYVLLVQ
ncbi:hypothetical protein BCR34DRAFT_601606 [Clohesyomyces aquaticus]|uniref:Uncharacterized protein n=1 Tax=Clohesyomyces aquaticus TaxID=1231657 RepID=A0A1Y1ZLR5_9PLEO|nr:hypothetical protein BCR34DRAFT_601606 [Clohesyomyces aquaticus]